MARHRALADEPALGYLPPDIVEGSGTVNRARLVRLWPYAAAIGGLILAIAVFVAFERPAALDLWSWAVGAVETKWRRFLVGPAGQLMALTIFVIVLELFFLSWEKTTVFRVFVRRSASAVTDLGFALITFSSFKWLV